MVDASAIIMVLGLYIVWIPVMSEIITGFSQKIESHVPPELMAFVGNKYLFKVEVSDGNITQGWQTFTAKKMTSDVHIVQQYFKQHDLLVR